MKKTLGGDRLGSGKKMQVELHNYGRSTHNLSREWRSTMTQGTLVPFLMEPILPGDTFDIDLRTMVRTMPTLGPIFGTMKMQLDVFLCPMRLYIAELHNNKLGIGMNMANVKLPKMELTSPPTSITPWESEAQRLTRDPNQDQINPSSILAYMGYRGLGSRIGGNINVKKQALPILMYWDAYKNYYANKQEGIGALITQDVVGKLPVAFVSGAKWTVGSAAEIALTQDEYINLQTPLETGSYTKRLAASGSSDVYITLTGTGLKTADTFVVRMILGATAYGIDMKTGNTSPALPSTIQVSVGTSDTDTEAYILIRRTSGIVEFVNSDNGTTFQIEGGGDYEMAIKTFDLENIDNMREELLQQPSGTEVVINDLEAGQALPYLSVYQKQNATGQKMVTVGEMSGLGLKTYLSDRFNNWLDTEWIDGPNGIAEISKVEIENGAFTIDSLNLAKKIYNLLNRIAVSGGSYYDWTEAAYGEATRWQAETPMYMGGLSGELAFSEVVSTAEAGEGDGKSPLGSLAGRGTQIGERHGHIRVKAEEPSFVMGIISFTPRIDYSQGNKWYTRIDNMDQWHKPALDGIGFQPLVTDEMAAWDTKINNGTTPTYRTVGKQPSWIEYMTSQNECYGGFAQNDSQLFMTFNRRYRPDNNANIEDLTTYIDPRKYNNPFAVTNLTAQNLWVQIGINIKARRKMSAKMIPNL